MTNLKPLAIALMLMVGQQLSGVNAVVFFSVNIFESAHTSLNSFVENIIVGLVMVFATGLAAVFIDRLGRRILLITSALVMIITLYCLGLYFWIQKTHPALALTIDFLPLASLCLFIFAFSVGFGPIPWLMMSELFAPEVKGIDSAITCKI
jgi:MFS family permease